jgi:ribosomal protein L19
MTSWAACSRSRRSFQDNNTRARRGGAADGEFAMNLIQTLEKEQMEKLSIGREIPDFGPGDTVLVNVKIIEGDKNRIQAYEGVCIGRAGAGLNENFTVRKISYGEGVERVFRGKKARISEATSATAAEAATAVAKTAAKSAPKTETKSAPKAAAKK